MPAILPLLPDTLLGPDTLLHPDGVWVDHAWLFPLALSIALIPSDPAPRTDVSVAARTTSVSIATRTTSVSVPARVTAISEIDQVVA